MNKLRLTLIIIVILVIIVHFSFKQPTPESDDPFIGPENAELTIVEFGDYFCPATKQFYTLRFKELRESYPQVKWVYRDFPIGLDIAAQASNCAPDFWEFHEKLMTNFNLSRERLIELSDNNQDFIECLDSEKFKDEVNRLLLNLHKIRLKF